MSRIGVVAVHGVAPLPRYSFEDAFSAALRNALGAGWTQSTAFPPIPANIGTNPELVRMTSDRLENAALQKQIDVHEVYWSPIDKNKTNTLSVIAWLLDAIFVPLNNGARFPGAPWKGLYDVGYAVIAILLAAGLVGCGAFFGWHAYAHIIRTAVLVQVASGKAASSGNAPSFYDVLVNPLHLLSFLTLQEVALLVVGVAGVMCVARAISAGLGVLIVRRPKTTAAAMQKSARRTTLRIGLVLVIGVILSTIAAFAKLAGIYTFGGAALWFAGSVLFLQGASSLGRNLFVNRLGDVQIYTTGDENTEYFTYREQIRIIAERVLYDTIARSEIIPPGTAPVPYYDSIVVVGYSLGATIAMDAILRIHEVHEASQATISDSDWGRVRAFITMGCALEKTKYFFAVRDPSPSTWREQWTDELAGHLFTRDRSVLASGNPSVAAVPTGPRGIFWLNLWYFTDIIANEMKTFRSKTQARSWNQNATSESVCLNQRLARSILRDPFPHGSYLGDPNFWSGGSLPPSHGNLPCGALDVFNAL